ncbi:hypothetical protein [Bradyrhizobium sp. Bra64]|uniref:hypothetical protein n=1 Tax=Bradyrhizobium sp. Bra64 TaxID=2926009 RepID=UPI0021186457|nr:hypothetical protein [Bradyrhizobium sp. Bra64]
MMEFTNSGQVVVSGAHLGTVSPASNGETLGFAIDLDNQKFWVRKIGGDWLNLSFANPATNSNGISIPSGTYVPFSTFGGSFGTAGQIQTANFGGSAFLGAVPSGFTAGWPI